MKMIVLNLARATTQAELLNAFTPFGEVASCNLVMDKVTGKSKGFGFVEMPDRAAANEAIAKLHGTVFGGRKIRVKSEDSKKPV